ncbi:MAG: PIG-L family deacetylase [Chloroflexi bacterium]|nr:PIG-L family deacetylase [Chloroflexota bacterium]
MQLRSRWRRFHIARRFQSLVSWARRRAAGQSYPELVELPPGSNVLLLSPHPDDAALGAGGTLLKHSQAGCRVSVLVLTDGAAGVPGSPAAQTAALRRQEERAAAALLGVQRLEFWGQPDGALAASPTIARRLRALLDELQPDLVYLPYALDHHPDHRAVSPLLRVAAQGAAARFDCAYYEVGTPLLPNTLVDVSAQMELKLEAVRQHRSQVALVDYPALAQGLARYRAGIFSRQIQYAEAFYLFPMLML